MERVNSDTKPRGGEPPERLPGKMRTATPGRITNQIKASSFSYCLVDRDSSKSSTLEFNTGGLPGKMRKSASHKSALAHFRAEEAEEEAAAVELRRPETARELGQKKRHGQVVELRRRMQLNGTVGMEQAGGRRRAGSQEASRGGDRSGGRLRVMAEPGKLGNNRDDGEK